MRTRSSSVPTEYQNESSNIATSKYWAPSDAGPGSGLPSGDTPGAWNPATDPPHACNPSIEVAGGLSVITDEPNKAHRTKYVDHIQNSWRYSQDGGFEYYSFVGDFWDSRNRWTQMSGKFCGLNWFFGNDWPALPGVDSITVTWDKDDASLLLTAMHKLMNGNDVDNFTNIRESGQTVDMLRGLGDKWRAALLWMPFKRRFIKGRAFGEFAPDWSRAAKFYSKKVKDLFKSSPSTIANGYLAYSFGVAPLVSDLKTMAISMRTLKSDVEKHKFRGQRRTAHASCPGHMSVSGLGSQFWPPYGSGSGSQLFDIASPLEGSFRKVVTVIGKDSTHYNTDLFRNLDYGLKRFLSAGPASALWEAIPYSFVLDWFVNSSRVIDSIDNTLTGDTRKITDGCVSTRADMEVQMIYKPFGYSFSANNHDSFYGRQIGVIKSKRYHRQPIAPSSWGGASGRFGKKQGSLLAALIHQRVANLKFK